MIGRVPPAGTVVRAVKVVGVRVPAIETGLPARYSVVVVQRNDIDDNNGKLAPGAKVVAVVPLYNQDVE